MEEEPKRERKEVRDKIPRIKPSMWDPSNRSIPLSHAPSIHWQILHPSLFPSSFLTLVSPPLAFLPFANPPFCSLIASCYHKSNYIGVVSIGNRLHIPPPPPCCPPLAPGFPPHHTLLPYLPRSSLSLADHPSTHRLRAEKPRSRGWGVYGDGGPRQTFEKTIRCI